MPRLVPYPVAALLAIAAPLAAQHVTTKPEISPADLRARLFAVAHDSMMGREPGQEGNSKASAYVASEFKRLGLQPAGDDRSFFQIVPFFRRTADRRDTLRLDGVPLTLGVDYVVAPIPARWRGLEGAGVVFGGLATDQNTWIDSDAARGKIVVLRTLPPEQRTVATRNVPLGALGRSPRFAGAAAIMVAELGARSSEMAASAMSGSLVLDTTWTDAFPPLILTTRALGDRLFSSPLDAIAPGTTGRALSGRARMALHPLEFAARNVVAVLRGSDPARREQYVSLTAHNDHVGYDHSPVDHDSLRAFDRVIRPMGADSPRREPTAVEWRRIRVILDSLRAVNKPRLDSIRNGADDDGTGTVALLEIAERLVRGPRPKRSILFVSHTAEEFGLLGSRWFTDHPTVPRDSIISEIDMDMIGRGSVDDLPDAGPQYLEVIGLRRLSKEFGGVIDSVNARQPLPFTFNLTYDQPGHPLQYYCRADHYSYARYGIPAIAVSRGEHLDYHQVTDEAQYIDYDALSRVTRFVHDAALALANRANRPALDAPKGDPNAPCRQ
jgi:hypothetical protein